MFSHIYIYMYVARQQEKAVLKHVRETSFSSNLTLFLDAILITFSPRAR